MTLSALGIFSAAGAGGGVVADYELITTTILGSNASSVTFDVSSFASTYKHLQIRLVARSTNAGSDYVNITLNGAGGYWQHGMEAFGTTTPNGYGSTSSSIAMAQMANNNDSANIFGAGVIDILDPFTTKNKTLRGLGGVAGTDVKNVALRSGFWASTSSVTSIGVQPFQASNFVTGSRFSLYGLRG